LLDGTLDMDQYVRMLNSRTKLVAVTHVSNTLGTHVDIKTIIMQAHAVHAKVLVDAAQSVPHQPIDMQDLDVDFLVFSGHKMMAPTGIGVVYINRRLHHELVPYQLGGGMVYEASFDQATYLPMPHLLEAGTPPIAQAIGLAAAIDYIQQHIDFTELQKHEAVLCARLIEGLQKYENKPGSLPALSLVEGSKDKPNHITILGPIDQLKKSGHLVSFVVEGIHAHDIAACLDRHGIATRAGHHCAQPLAKKLGVTASVRVSFYWYNTIEEVERILEVIDALLHG
jgi:cysteine desulfurase/selenocysteine lyase